MSNWVEERISFIDYISMYADNPDVKFIPHTANKGVISVLVNKDKVKNLECHHVPTQNLF